MDRLPSELMLNILREATLTANVFVYPLDHQKDQDATLFRTILDGMRMKSALSLVSRKFHDLVEQFLLQSVYIRRQERLAAALSLLSHPSSGSHARGWWCRQLIIEIRHYTIDWAHGDTLLCKLIASCPRLLDLRLLLFRPTYQVHIVEPSLALLQAIASVPGPGLRYLHLGEEVAITLQRALRLLPHLPALKVCRLEYLTAIHHHTDLNGTADVTIFQPLGDDEDGDEGSEEQVGPYVVEARNSQKTVGWPSTLETVICPSLRTLQCNTFVPDIGRWQVPKLQEVVVGLSMGFEPSARIPMLCEALAPHATHITHFTYTGIVGLDMWQIVQLLPNLEQIRSPFEDTNTRGSLRSPHTCLSTIIIGVDSLDGPYLSSTVQSIREHHLGQYLPELKKIVFEGETIGAARIAGIKATFKDMHVDVAERIIRE